MMNSLNKSASSMSSLARIVNSSSVNSVKKSDAIEDGSKDALIFSSVMNALNDLPTLYSLVRKLSPSFSSLIE